MALSDQFDMDGASIIAFLIGLVIVFDQPETLNFSRFNLSFCSTAFIQFWISTQNN